MKPVKIYDGANIIIGLQGFGKSYYGTILALSELLNKKSKRKVLSNYPIVVKVPLNKKQKLINFILHFYKSDSHTFRIGKKEIILQEQIQEVRCSNIWDDAYTGRGVKDALVILDESGADKYTGTYAYELTKDDRKFFRRLRHHNVSVYLMSASADDIHPFIKRGLAYVHDVHNIKFPWSKTPYRFFVDTYTSIKDYLKRDEHKHNKRVRKTLFKHISFPFDPLVSTSYNTHFYRDISPEPDYIPWYNNITGELNDKTFIHPIVSEETIKTEPNIIRDSISTLMRLNKWKKKDANIEVHKIIVEYEPEDVDTVEKILKIALQRRAEVLEAVEKEE